MNKLAGLSRKSLPRGSCAVLAVCKHSLLEKRSERYG
jgi:hypothetical protein